MSESAVESEPGWLSDGRNAGRYCVLERVGTGGMGVVYRAYDPNLDRAIALKVVRPHSRREDKRKIARGRLLREAQALARLSHPNVVTAYDVGIIDDDIFIALELVEGKTLKEWLADQPPLRQRLRVLLEAGRGLAAAHAAGLIHRDFKPSNVIVGDDGRVRVVDFGLARAASMATRPDRTVSLEPIDPETWLAEAGALDEALTAADALVGTPAYMAPEQLMGLSVDAKTDQFAFCMTAYEALYGERPFPGGDLWQVRRGLLEYELRDPPRNTRVPQRLRRVLLHGLAFAQEERYPDMEALLADLVRNPTRRLLLGAGATAACALMASGGYALRPAVVHDRPICDPPSLASTWDADRKATLRNALTVGKLPYAEDAWRRVSARLDQYGRDWSAAVVDTCEATHLRGLQSERALDLRMQCLDRRRADLGALVDVLIENRGNQTVADAVTAVSELPAIGGCADLDRLSGHAPPPDSERELLESAQAQLSRVSALKRAGRYADALPAARAVVDQVERIDYWPIRVEALRALSAIETQLDRAEAAEASLQALISAAARAGDDRQVARAWSRLLQLIARERADPERALSLELAARTAVERAGDDPETAAAWHAAMSAIYSQLGRFEEAQAHATEWIHSLARLHEPNPLLLATAHNALGTTLWEQRQYDQAKSEFELALRLYEGELGPEHPDVARATYNLGIAHGELREVDLARIKLERAIAIWERTLPGSSALASALNSLGHLHRLQNHLDLARKLFERSLSVYTIALGPDHPTLAFPLNNLGKVDVDEKQPERALAPLERALALRTTNKVDPELVANTKFDLARALWNTKRNRPRALRLAHEALAIYQSVPSATDPAKEIQEWLAKHP